jgi:hypothetical protein
MAYSDTILRLAKLEAEARSQSSPRSTIRAGGPCHENLSLAALILAGQFSSCRGSGSPRPEGVVSEDAERAARCEMALDIESVLDGGVNGQEALG